MALAIVSAIVGGGIYVYKTKRKAAALQMQLQEQREKQIARIEAEMAVAKAERQRRLDEDERRQKQQVQQGNINTTPLDLSQLQSTTPDLNSPPGFRGKEQAQEPQPANPNAGPDCMLMGEALLCQPSSGNFTVRHLQSGAWIKINCGSRILAEGYSDAAVESLYRSLCREQPPPRQQ